MAEQIDSVDPHTPSVNPLTDVPIEVTVSIGRARPRVRELLKLKKNSVLTLDARIDDPVELYVGDRLIGLGTLELEDENEGHFVVRVREVIELKSSV